MAYPRQHPVRGVERTGHLREVGADAAEQRSSVGTELAEARLARGLDLRIVAEDLRIRYEHLRAIEEGRFGDLPGPTYVVGFLRSYAGYLGLDVDDLIRRFKTEATDLGAPQKLEFPSPAEDGRLPTGPILLLALALAGAAYAGWYYVTSVERTALEGVPEVPERLAARAGSTASPAEEAATAKAGQAPDIVAARPAESEASPGPESATPTIAEDQTAEPAPEATAETELPTTVATREVSRAPEITVEPEASPAVTLAEAPAADAGAGAAGAPPIAAAEPPPTDTSVSTPGVAEAEAGDSGSAAEVAAIAPPEVGTSVPAALSSSGPGTAEAEPTGAATTAREEPSGADEPAAAEAENTGLTPEPPAVPERPNRREGANATTPASEPPGDPQAPSTATEREATAGAPRGGDAEPRIAVAPAVPPPEVESSSGYVPRIFGQGNADARIELRATRESWVQITGEDSELLLTRILRPGDVYYVPDRSGLVLMTGNAGGLEITVDGKPAPALGPVGAVLRNVALDPDALLAGEAVSR